VTRQPISPQSFSQGAPLRRGARHGETMLDTEIPFDLPDDAVADAVTPDTRPDRVVRAAFKTAESIGYATSRTRRWTDWRDDPTGGHLRDSRGVG